jgi:hypothetical protein
MAFKAKINTSDTSNAQLLLDAYDDFQKDASIDKTDANFQKYIDSKNLWFAATQVKEAYTDLANPATKRETVLANLEPKAAAVSEAQVQEIIEGNRAHADEMGEAHRAETTSKAMKMDELKNLLQDKPENVEANAQLIVKQAQARLWDTIERYTAKIRELKDSNAKEIADLRAEIKKEKDTYEQVRADFFAKSDYTFENFSKEDLAKIPTNIIRYKTREGKLFNAPGLTKMKTLRRNKTIKTLIKKFNKIGNNPKNGVRFVMWFEKERFLRYTGVKVYSAVDRAGSSMGLQMDANEFHSTFNTGRKNIFAILDANTGDKATEGEKEMIAAIKKRINYFGYAYARERANARTAPFIEAEKNASPETRIIQMKSKWEKDNVVTMKPQGKRANVA